MALKSVETMEMKTVAMTANQMVQTKVYSLVALKDGWMVDHSD